MRGLHQAAGPILLALLLSAAAARADPGQARLSVEGGLGGALTLTAGAFSHVKLEQSAGWQLAGEEGPTIGAAVQESFGPGGFVLQLGPRLCWYLRPLDGWEGLYIAPVAQLGYAAVYFTGPFGLGGWAHRFDIQLAVQAELVVWRQWRVFIRPVAFDLQLDDDGAALRYDLMAGVGTRLSF